MPRVCPYCGRVADTRHHIIAKRYNGYEGPQEKICRSCHDDVENVLRNATRSIPGPPANQQVQIGNVTAALTLGSAFPDEEIQEIVGDKPVLGFDIIAPGCPKTRFEASLSGGSVVLFIGSPEPSKVYYSVLYKDEE